jgi:hypothetical protein
MLTIKSSVARTALDVAILLVLTAGALAPAQAMRFKHVHIGGGDSLAAVAVINDLHSDEGWLDNLTSAVTSINALTGGPNGVRLVLVVGDFTNNNDPTDLLSHIQVLEGLDVPWVPIAGNHDMVYYWDLQDAFANDTTVRPGDDTMLFVTRKFFHAVRAEMDTLKANSADSTSPVRDFRRYEHFPWCNALPNNQYRWDQRARDVNLSSSFRLGQTPYRFLCVDFSTRMRAVAGKPGMAPHATVDEMSFNDAAIAARVVAHDAGQPAECRLYVDDGFRGEDSVILGAGTTELASPLRGEVSSVRFVSNCDSVILYAASDQHGDVRWELTESDSSLSENGPAEWWHSEFRRLSNDISGERELDKLLVFSHQPPLTFWLGVECAMVQPDYGHLVSFCDDFRNEIGGWFSGHITPGFWSVPEQAALRYLLNPEICRRRVLFPNGGADGEDGNITLLYLRYDPVPDATIVVDASGVTPDPCDATVDSMTVVACTAPFEGTRNVTVDLCDENMSRLCRICEGTGMLGNETYGFGFDGRTDAGSLFLPNDDYRIDFTTGTKRVAVTSFAVAGACLSGSVKGVLDSLCDPAVLTGNVTVPAGDTLIIQPGVRVMPAGDYKVQVYGTLIARGGEADSERILFTPYRRMKPVPDSCWPGFWKGIEVMPGGRCSLDNCVIEYAGGTPGVDSAAVAWHDAGTMVMTNSVIRQSSTRGVWGGGEDDLAAVLRGDTFERCVSYPVATYPDSVGPIAAGNVFRDNGTRAFDVRVHPQWGNKYLRASATWPACESLGWRYDVRGNLSVYNPDAAGTCTLRVGAGVTLRLGDQYGNANALEVGCDATHRGRLEADGSAGRTTFTGRDTLSTGNYWGGIEFRGYSSGLLDSCRISHSKYDNVHILPTATVMLRHCAIRKALDCGVENDGAALVVKRCTLAQNAIGIQSEREGTGMVIDTCTFVGNAIYGLRLADFDAAVTRGCEFVGNERPARLRANLVSDFVARNTFAGNAFKGVVIGDGTASSAITSGTHTWTASPELCIYRCSTDVEVEGSKFGGGSGVDADADAGGTRALGRPGEAKQPALSRAGAESFTTPTLVLSPGVTVQLRENKTLKIDEAVLTARGHAGAEVCFDNFETGAFWNSVFLDHAHGSVLEYCRFDRGGYDGATLPAVEGALYCYNSDNVVIRRCTFTNACRRDTSVGLQVKSCAPDISQCRFDNCGRGIGIDNSDGSLPVDSCEFEACREGVFVEGGHPSLSTRCNFIDNTFAGVNNQHAKSPGTANYCHWSNPTYPYGPHGGDTAYYTTWTGARQYPVGIIPELDVSAEPPLDPAGVVHADSAAIIEPSGWLHNEFDDTVVVTAWMKIGAGYERSVQKTLGAGATGRAVFPACTLWAGTYAVTFRAALAGDEDPQNDTIADTVVVRPYVDAAALAVLAPAGNLTVEDTIAPAVRVANRGGTAQDVPVRLLLDGTPAGLESVSLAPHETTEVAFAPRGFAPGQRTVRFAASLDGDEARANDTAGIDFTVKAGDYWRAESAPGIAAARLAWDGDDYVYAGERGGTTVRRYSIAGKEWSDVAGPPLECVRGLCGHDGDIYALGFDAAKKAKGKPVTDGTGRICRYEPSGDSWILLDATVALADSGDDAALVSDGNASIYVIPGQSGQLGRSFVSRLCVAADSAILLAEPGLHFGGAAGWSGAAMYALLDSVHLQRFDSATLAWSTLANPTLLMTHRYGPVLCTGPGLDLTYAVWPKNSGLAGSKGLPAGGPAKSEPVFHLWERDNTTGGWVIRAELPGPADGGGLCPAATDRYFADGAGGFWRYRPLTMLDVGSRRQDGVAGTPVAPQYLYLWGCVPNPFSRQTDIRWQVTASGPVMLRVHDAAGRLVRTLVNGPTGPGCYTTTWDGTDAGGRAAAAGVYFCTLEAGGQRLGRKMVLGTR